MQRVRSSGRFFGAWLVFAVLSGLGLGFLGGLLTTLFGFFAVLDVLGGSGTNRPLGSSINALFQQAPAFASAVLWVTAYGFVNGFFSGLLAAPFGGRKDTWWLLIPAAGLLFLLPSHLQMLFPLLFLGLLGVAFPLNFLRQKSAWFGWDEPVREWLQTTWVKQPPIAMRLIGIGLPLLLGLGVETGLTWAEYQRHSAYIPRIGRWETWQSSRVSLHFPNQAMRRYSCQSNLKQIMFGVMQYTQDYDDMLPRSPVGNADGVSALIQPYLRTTELFQCPADFYKYRGGEFSNGDFTDYWYNARFYNMNLNAVTNSSTSIMWGDGNTGSGEANSAYSLRSIPPLFSPATRHLSRANYAFADGHVKSLISTAISNTAPPGSTPTMLP